MARQELVRVHLIRKQCSQQNRLYFREPTKPTQRLLKNIRSFYLSFVLLFVISRLQDEGSLIYLHCIQNAT